MTPDSDHAPGTRGRPALAVRRLAVAAGAGAAAGAIVWWPAGPAVATLLAWSLATGTFLLRTWTDVWPLDATGTKQHCTQEDPGQPTTSALLLVVAGVSLVLVVLVMFEAPRAGPIDTVLGLVSLSGSWGLLQTVHLVRYARLYYVPPEGGLDFHQDEAPAYRDFAYLAITVGTTFQAPDVDVTSPVVRSVVLRHGLLAFAFNSVVLAATINVIAGLGG